MGLLDSVLGQVIGGLAGSQGTSASTQQGGAWNQSGGAGGQSGGINPLVLALLSLVASRTLGQGAGGLGSTLRDVLTHGSGTAQGGGLGGMFGGSQTGAPAGAQTGGGFLDQIGGMLGGAAGVPGGATAAGPGGMGGLGGGLTSGGLGGLMGGGLGGLLERFAQNGHGDAMNSWIGKGANQSIEPHQLDTALGSGTVDELSRQTGLDRGDLLSQLSEALPQVVDGLTPQGRLPETHEEAQWV